MRLPTRRYGAALACLLGLIAPVAGAQDRYDVEIIVFEHDNERDITEERWQAAIVAPAFERGRLLETAGGEDGLPEAFEALRSAEGELRQSARRLEQSGQYRVLRHLRWRQPALGPGESIPIRVRDGEAMPVTTPVNQLQQPVPSRGNQRAQADDEADGETAANGEADTGDESGDTAAGDTAPAGAPASATGVDEDTYFGPYGPRERTVAVHPLDGTIELVVSRYLHIHVDLYRTVPVEWEPLTEGERAVGDEAGDAVGDAAAEGGADAAAGGEDRAGRRTDLARVPRGPDGATVVSFPFRQSRRMRSGELHYIDHPKLGVLVLVKPYEEPAEEEANGNGDGGA